VRTAEELRRSALERLGSEADPRVVDLLSHAGISVAWAVARWDSSAGPVDGHRVSLALDASQLGGLRATPAAHDAMCAALASAIAMQPGESLLDVTTRWAPDAHAVAAGYRDAPPPKVTLKQALVAYLEGAGSMLFAAAVQDARVERAGVTDVVIRGLPDTGSVRLSELTSAVRDLLGEATRVRLEP
jgi:hypothetical protein